MDLTRELREALATLIASEAAGESEAGESTTNGLSEQERFGCRYAAARLRTLANDIRWGHGHWHGAQS